MKPRIFDCDIHCSPNAQYPLEPFIPARYQTALLQGMAAGRSHSYTNPFGVNRRDADFSTPDDFLCNHIDRYGVTYGLLQPQFATTYSLAHSIDIGNVLCRAANDWLVEHYLSHDPRFLGSISINTADPREAAKEIRRMATHRQMVQINVAGEAHHLYGHRFYEPIFEACEEYQLVFALHPGAEGSLFSSTPVGRPSSYFEWHVSLPQTFMAHTASLVLEGTFEKFPNFRVLLTEGGFGWLPHLMWRMDKDFKGLRSTVPWLKEAPSAYLLRHVRLTTQPMEEPPHKRHLFAMLEMIEAERTLCFSSDFPHWDFDDPVRSFPPGLDEGLKERILWSNAAALFAPRLPQLREEVQG